MANFNPLKSTLAVTKITILVVDDDATSLTVVAAMLRERYGVTTVTSPHDALSTLRARPGIDLVVTDLHMPGMDGLQLKRQIDDEFNLPVIIMSSDDKESVILHSLACGAVSYIVKPVNSDDLKNVWQCAVRAKKQKSPIIEEIGTLQEESESSQDCNNMSITDEHSGDSNSGASSVDNDDNNGVKRTKKGGKKKKMGRDGKDSDEKSAAPKKAKVVWTNSLHDRFLQAIRLIGLEKAVPKKILECMNVSGLTRENVASHLQKYRLFLKRVAEKGMCPPKALTERALRSNFATGHVMTLQQQQMGRLNNSHLGYARSSTLRTAHPNFLTLQFPGQGASSFRSNNRLLGPGLPGCQFGYGQSNLQHNQANRQQALFGNTSSFNYQANHPGFGVGSNNFGNNFSRNGGFSSEVNNPSSNGLINGTNLSPMPVYPQQGTQARPNLYNVGNGNTSTAQFQFGASTFDNSTSATNPSNIGDSFIGTKMTSNGEFGVSQIQFNNSTATNPISLSGSYSGTRMTGVYGNGNMNNDTTDGSPDTGLYGNGNMNSVAPMLRNENSGNLDQGSFLPAGFGQVPNQVPSPIPGFGQVPNLVPPPIPGFGQVPNQVPPPIPILATTNNQQPPMSEGLFSLGTGGENDSNFNFLNNASVFDENVDSLIDSTKFEFPLQHQGGENVMNSDIANSSNPDGLNQIVDQILDPNLSGAGSFSVNGGDQLGNNSTTANNISPLGEYYPSFDQNAIQQQSGGENNIIYPKNNASQIYQSWSDELMDDCFQF